MADNVVAALISSGAAILGAIAGGGASMFAGQRLWKQQQRDAFNRARMNAYADLLSESHVRWSALMNWRRLIAKRVPEAGSAGVEADAARTVWLAKRSATELVASETTRRAAFQLSDFLSDVHDSLYAANRSDGKQEPDSKAEYDLKFNELTTTFVACAQADIRSHSPKD